MKALLIVSAFLVVLVGCSQKEGVENSAEAQEPAKKAVEREYDTSVRTNRMTTEAFFQMIYSDYEKAGRKDPKWDHQAKEYFSVLGSTFGKHDHQSHQQIERLRGELHKIECEDPLVRYMIMRQTQDSHKSGKEGTNDWTQVALDLDSSSYHQYWKFFSFMRAAQAHKSANPGSTNSPEVLMFRSQASDRLVELINDPELPTSVVYDAVFSWLINDLWGSPNLRRMTYDRLEPMLLGGWGDTAEAQLIRGAYHLAYAWDARGGGWATTVTDEGWRLMKERLGVARESLERSWIIKPILETALQMQWVELGDSRGRKEMERWFDNAMELDPGNYKARMNKLNWLHEKWHGSIKEMLAFGNDRLTDTNGTAALTLYEVHLELAKYHRQREAGTENDYLKQPKVWPDVKRSFEAFFAVHPDDVGWRHNYALAAYRCEAWDDLRKQIKLMGPVNYEYFGGKEAFEEMVRKAEQYGKEPVSS